ncbi:hypothetical protein Q5752_006046 [Cryptotrichosporon argae]
MYSPDPSLERRGGGGTSGSRARNDPGRRAEYDEHRRRDAADTSEPRDMREADGVAPYDRESARERERDRDRGRARDLDLFLPPAGVRASLPHLSLPPPGLGLSAAAATSPRGYFAPSLHEGVSARSPGLAPGLTDPSSWATAPAPVPASGAFPPDRPDRRHRWSETRLPPLDHRPWDPPRPPLPPYVTPTSRSAPLPYASRPSLSPTASSSVYDGTPYLPATSLAMPSVSAPLPRRSPPPHPHAPVWAPAPAPATADGEPRRKKRRQALACAECSKRKQRCNREVPCNHCVSRNVPHLCVPTPMRDGTLPPCRPKAREAPDGLRDGQRDGRRDGRHDGLRDGSVDGYKDGMRDGARDVHGPEDGLKDGQKRKPTRDRASSSPERRRARDKPGRRGSADTKQPSLRDRVTATERMISAIVERLDGLDEDALAEWNDLHAPKHRGGPPMIDGDTRSVEDDDESDRNA